MIVFNDLVITENEMPTIKFTPEKEKYSNLSIEIYKHKKLIYTGKLDREVGFDNMEKDLENFNIEINYKNKIQTFPLTVLRLKENEKYIVCDIDFTVSATNLLFFLNKRAKMKTIFYSIEALRKLARKYKIVYLTGRVKEYNKFTRIWLKENKFPSGPIIGRDREQKYSLQEFKSKKLKEITQISSNAVGIGDLATDIFAYLENGLTAIKIGHPLFYYSKKSEYIDKGDYYQVFSWKGIEKIFNDKKLFK
jgi:phosphatidate phosphatase PAH1